MKYGKKKITKRTKKSYNTAKKKTFDLSKSLSKAVDVIVKKNIETKTSQSYFDGPAGNYNNLNIQIFPISPYVGSGNVQIEQGVGDGMRIGNKIDIVNGSINILTIADGYDTVTNNLRKPIYMQYAIFYDKLLPTNVPDATQMRANFFNLDNATSPMGGTLIDSIKYINTDRYQVYRYWKEKIGFQSYNGVAGVISDNYFYGQNNDFKLLAQKKIDITKYLAKRLSFNDNNNTPTTRALFIAYWAIQADGNLLPDNQFPATVYLANEIRYKDA